MTLGPECRPSGRLLEEVPGSAIEEGSSLHRDSIFSPVKQEHRSGLSRPPGTARE